MGTKKIVLILFAFCLTVAVWADVDTMPEMFMNFAVGNYLPLYPEAAYRQNPANILQLDRPVFITDIFFNGDGYTFESTHPSGWAGAGDPDGTYFEREKNRISNGFDVDGFLPLNPDMTLGFGAMLDLYCYKYLEEYNDWTASPEDISYEEKYNSQLYSGTGYFAYRLGNLELGASGGLAGERDPYDAATVTDASVNNGEPYYFGLPDSLSTMIWAPNLTVGGIYRMDRFTFSLGAMGMYLMHFGTDHVAVDKDGNGFDETIVTLEDYWTTSAAWGGGPFPEYNWKDEIRLLNVTAYPAVIFELSPSFSLIGTGWAGFGFENELYYEHFAAADKDEFRMDYRFPNFGATVGFAWDACEKLELRAGLGYQGSGLKQTNNDLDIAGDSVWDPANTDHYFEVNWAVDPADDAVSSLVGTFDSSRTFTHTIAGMAAAEYMPAPNVLLFSGAMLGFNRTVDTYNVFNLFDDSIWEERVIQNSIDIDYSILIGAGMFVTDKIFLGIQGQSGYASFGFDTDELPTSKGKETTDATSNRTTIDRSRDYYINLFCVLGL